MAAERQQDDEGRHREAERGGDGPRVRPERVDEQPRKRWACEPPEAGRGVQEAHERAEAAQTEQLREPDPVER
jgi:hypothetical protein